MRAVAQQTLLGAALLILTLFGRAAGSNPPYILPSQIPVNPPASREIEPLVARWLAQLNSSDEEKRREAVMELSHIDSTAATSALLAALTDSSPGVRAAAAAGIAERREAPAVPLLAACLARDKDAFVRKMAAYALGRFQGTERTVALAAALTDKSLEVRGAAAVSLGDHADAAAVAPLVTALSDKSAFVRAHSARALGINGAAAKQSVPALVKLLTSDEDGEARRQATTALGLIGDRSALSALELARHDKDPYLVQAAIEAIRIIDEKK